MLEFSLYVNMMLFIVGLMLIFVIVAKQKQHPVMVRAILMAYFLVVLQYNLDRLQLTGHKLMIASAAIALVAWIRQPIPATETD